MLFTNPAPAEEAVPAPRGVTTHSSEDLQQIAARTLAHYELHAQIFWKGTRNHDVSQNIASLLNPIAVPARLDLLDFCCCPGRHLRTFREMGPHAVGV